MDRIARSHAAHPSPDPIQGHVLRTVSSRVTIFYQFRDKAGKYHKMASVSNTLLVKVLKPDALRLDKVKGKVTKYHHG